VGQEQRGSEREGKKTRTGDGVEERGAWVKLYRILRGKRKRRKGKQKPRLKQKQTTGERG